MAIMPEPESTPITRLACPVCGEPNDAHVVRHDLVLGVYTADCRCAAEHIWSVRWFGAA